ncbi:MAG TPA: 7-cyano-7-deazaguanine synthase [Phycisphaerae bacterium]|nr:7-cyano-7-deazaguanine synthase [Phycisphaerae bacterium]
MAKAKAVVLCSGGLNSTVAAAMTQQQHTLAMLHVRFGHRAAEKEARLFADQLEYFKPQQHLTIDMPHFAAIGGNARTSRKFAIEDARALGEARTNAYIPGLITTLLGAAYTWAGAIGANKIVLGVSEDLGPPAPKTSTLYPDFAREYIELVSHAFLFASAQRPINVDTPIIDLERAEIIKLGNRLAAPFEMTWSCLSSAEQACGGCVGCSTRARGFVDAGIPDPILSREPAGIR